MRWRLITAITFQTEGRRKVYGAALDTTTTLTAAPCIAAPLSARLSRSNLRRLFIAVVGKGGGGVAGIARADILHAHISVATAGSIFHAYSRALRCT